MKDHYYENLKQIADRDSPEIKAIIFKTKKDKQELIEKYKFVKTSK